MITTLLITTAVVAVLYGGYRWLKRERHDDLSYEHFADGAERYGIHAVHCPGGPIGTIKAANDAINAGHPVYSVSNVKLAEMPEDGLGIDEVTVFDEPVSDDDEFDTHGFDYLDIPRVHDGLGHECCSRAYPDGVQAKRSRKPYSTRLSEAEIEALKEDRAAKRGVPRKPSKKGGAK